MDTSVASCSELVFALLLMISGSQIKDEDCTLLLQFVPNSLERHSGSSESDTMILVQHIDCASRIKRVHRLRPPCIIYVKQRVCELRRTTLRVSYLRLIKGYRLLMIMPEQKTAAPTQSTTHRQIQLLHCYFVQNVHKPKMTHVYSLMHYSIWMHYPTLSHPSAHWPEPLVCEDGSYRLSGLGTG